MPIVRVRVRVCMCLYTPGPRNYFVFFLLSETLDPQYERETPSPILAPFIYRRRNVIVVVMVVVVVVVSSRMFSREKRNGEGEDSIHKF